MNLKVAGTAQPPNFQGEIVIVVAFFSKEIATITARLWD
jgi:hypothetical protein